MIMGISWLNYMRIYTVVTKTKIKRKTLTCMDNQSAEVRAVLLAEDGGVEPHPC